MDLKKIKKRLRELRADPGQAGATAEIQRLRGELTRARQAQDVADMSAAARRSRPGQERDRDADTATDDLPASVTAELTDADRAAVATWPPSLRAQLRRSSLSRPLSGGDDPGGYGARNDLRQYPHWS
ncbi:hypothetical protein [Streptomyces sp. NBC_00588]|uniref:hypothetical protein n=1 Tax=Streptomyces sp. NBC_00588 TaxID=2975784 RepID=UPI002E818A12|nr:hypothetical protein [Streptomyces sp. NBC_00588]WUB35523.1 hypothetical protein OHN38_11580 [Streptomyces sp. NBC_00588]